MVFVGDISVVHGITKPIYNWEGITKCENLGMIGEHFIYKMSQILFRECDDGCNVSQKK